MINVTTKTEFIKNMKGKGTVYYTCCSSNGSGGDFMYKLCYQRGYYVDERIYSLDTESETHRWNSERIREYYYSKTELSESFGSPCWIKTFKPSVARRMIALASIS